MTQGQQESMPFHCPRCGGLMRKPAGSTLYWHVDNNHPRCDITNIPETTRDAQTTAQTSEQSPTAPKSKDRL